MGTLKQFSRIQSDDPSLNRLQDQLASALNPILRNVQGDLSGPLESPTVTKLQGRNLAPIAPQTGQALIWNGTQWAPATTSAGTVTLAGDATGPSNANTVERIQNYDVSNAAPSVNDALVWDGSQWTPTAISTSSIYPQQPAPWGTEYLWWRCDDAQQPGATANFVANYGSAGAATLTSTNTWSGGSNGGQFYSKVPMLGVPGQFQTISRFSNTRDALRGANAIYPATSQITVSAWMRAQDQGLVTVVSKGNQLLGNDSVAIIWANQRVYYNVRTGGVVTSAYTQVNIPPSNEVLMLSLVCDGVSVFGYMNGQVVVSGPLAATGPIDWFSGVNDYWQICDANATNGCLDVWDVRVAAVVRTEAQLFADYQTGSGYSY
jgi:hypothetical protein